MNSSEENVIFFDYLQDAARAATAGDVRLLKNRIEYRLEITGR